MIETDSDKEEDYLDGDVDQITLEEKDEELLKRVEIKASILASFLNAITMLRQSSITVAKVQSMRKLLHLQADLALENSNEADFQKLETKAS